MDKNTYSPTKKSAFKKSMSIVSAKIYENNPFKILGLPTRASLAEAQKKAEKLMMMKRLGINDPSVPQELGEHDIRDAVASLQDPWKRIIYEIFWDTPESDEPSKGKQSRRGGGEK